MTMERTVTQVALLTALIAALGLIPQLTLAFGVPITAQSLGVSCSVVLYWGHVGRLCCVVVYWSGRAWPAVAVWRPRWSGAVYIPYSRVFDRLSVRSICHGIGDGAS